MSSKRSRAIYEADLAAQQSPYVVFGTPLPPLDPEVRDDGSYVPVWKQEVRDERGRRRLHGAFTGGWSAGYFNTVGSKEGWTPSTFVSSRTNRRKDDPNVAGQRPEDFMDDEDLRDAEEASKVQTNAAFAGLGSAAGDARGAGGLTGLFRVRGETMGTKLLNRMGWKEGQGIGPKIRRRARLDTKSAAEDGKETYLFAPENVATIRIVKKGDRKGLGCDVQPRLPSLSAATKNGLADRSDEEAEEDVASPGKPRFTSLPRSEKVPSKGRTGIGIGILNDTGSDDEDPYEIGPRISYNRVIGGDRKKKKKSTGTAVNPSVKTKPAFVPKRSALGRLALGLRKCHDGRLPLKGFVFGLKPDSLTSDINSAGKYPPPEIPQGWKSSRQPKESPGEDQSQYVSTADAARASDLNPRARAALLGEKQLPGKSVFDFMSASARERLAAVTGRADLPPAKGEIPHGFSLSEEERLRNLMDQVPKLDKETAVAALSRGAAGGGPYGNDEGKRARYRAYLELHAGLRDTLAQKPPAVSSDDWLRELHEFFNCARIFKPMTGLMASRFTTSSTALEGKNSPAGSGGVVAEPRSEPQDPAEEAARLGMFGQMTRTVTDFYPTRLLCKRFNVPPPAHVRPDQDATSTESFRQGSLGDPNLFADLQRPNEVQGEPKDTGGIETRDPGPGDAEKPLPHGLGQKEATIDSTRNEALEGSRAGEEVFRAIFGADSDEE